MLFFTAKNLALAGVKSVTIYDPEPVTVEDLGTQVRNQWLDAESRYTLTTRCDSSSFSGHQTSESRARTPRFPV